MTEILFDRLNKSDIELAVNRIEAEGIPDNRISKDYDVWVNGKTFPPPYLLSIINQEKGGDDLRLSDFGNNTDKAFQYFEDAGFRVMPKWVSLYQEIASKLDTYDNGLSGELVSILKQVGITIGTNDKNQSKQLFPLEEIDPFTFLSIFNKYGDDQRAEYLKVLKEIWGLKSTIPKSYPGVPRSNPQSTWLFPYSYERNDSDVPNLWQLYVELRNETIAEDSFASCLAIKHTGKAKLSDILFCYDPFKHITLNNQTIPFFQHKGVNTEFETYRDYVSITKEVQDKVGSNFVNISRQSYEWKQKQSFSYFIFKSNPKQWDLEKHLRIGDVDTWSVTKLHKHIDIGDKVILWQTGEKEGVYALAEITSEIKKRDMAKEAEEGDWKDDSYKKMEDLVDIEITHNLVEHPILWDQLEPSGLFKKLPQGTNFKATKDQFEHILRVQDKRDTGMPSKQKQYFKCATGYNNVYWRDFKDNGLIAIEKDEIGDFSEYNNSSEIGGALGMDGSRDSTPRMIELFIRGCKVGDVIIAASGVNAVNDVGIVEGPVKYDNSRSINKNYREVRWLGLDPIDLKDKIADIRYARLFRTDNFHRVVPYEFILGKYVEEHPEYEEIFQNEGLSYTYEDIKITSPVKDYGNPNIILYGPPGTGKTYSTIDISVEIATGENRGHENNKIKFDELRGSGQIEFITFHQNYAYEDFVVGMRPDIEQEQLMFKPHKGIFYQMCKRSRDNYEASQKGESAKKSFSKVFEELIGPLQENEPKEVPITMKSGIDFYITDLSERTIHFRKQSGGTAHTLSISTLKELVEGTREMPSGLSSYYAPLVDLIQSRQHTQGKAEAKKNYVLIIDEINRGNISRIFGELITLLEDDKRIGQDNELLVTLPNGERNFGVPPNLYLIGTMNTADKSIALLDIALRRRFEFRGIYPDYELLSPDMGENLKKLNEAILEAKKSPDFMIGHAYFINQSDDSFPQIMNKKIIPLLYEYFNGRDEFVKRILDSAELVTTKNPYSYAWEISES